MDATERVGLINATGKVVRLSEPSRYASPTAVVLENGDWYWLTRYHAPVDPGQVVRIRYLYGDQFCEIAPDEERDSGYLHRGDYHAHGGAPH